MQCWQRFPKRRRAVLWSHQHMLDSQCKCWSSPYTSGLFLEPVSPSTFCSLWRYTQKPCRRSSLTPQASSAQVQTAPTGSVLGYLGREQRGVRIHVTSLVPLRHSFLMSYFGQLPSEKARSTPNSWYIWFRLRGSLRITGYSLAGVWGEPQISTLNSSIDLHRARLPNSYYTKPDTQLEIKGSLILGSWACVLHYLLFLTSHWLFCPLSSVLELNLRPDVLIHKPLSLCA